MNKLIIIFLFISLSASGQDTLQTILRGCMKDALRLDSSLTAHKYKDSAIVILTDMKEDWRFISYLEKAKSDDKSLIIQNKDLEIENWKDDLKKEKKKKNVWKVGTGVATLLLILALI